MRLRRWRLCSHGCGSNNNDNDDDDSNGSSNNKLAALLRAVLPDPAHLRVGLSLGKGKEEEQRVAEAEAAVASISAKFYASLKPEYFVAFRLSQISSRVC